MASYASRVKRDLARWVERGLISAELSQTLAADIDASERRSLSFGSVLAMMAALLVGAAILVLVAANWEAIPRIVRVLALFAAIAVGYVGGALLKNRDHAAIGEALYIVGAATFGASLALVGQMYHMAGDEVSAIITWSVGTAIAAALLRSASLNIAAIGIALAWLVLWMTDYWGGSRGFPYYFIVLAALYWLLSYWTRSVVARHCVLLSVIFYVSLLVTEHDTVAVAVPMALVAALLFAASVFAPAPVERVAQLDGRLPAHCLIAFLVAVFILQIDNIDETARFALLALIAFAGIAAAVVLAGRESRGLRWLAYLGFSLELAFVYTVTVGTLLGTAGLFFVSGIALGLVAFIIIRIERRLRPPPAALAGAATAGAAS